MTGSASLSTTAYQHIHGKLLSGDLEAGAVVSELSLAREIGISRTPVRGAIQKLEEEGLVERVPRVGTIVRRPSIREIIDLYELREAIERFAVVRAAEEASPQEIAHMSKFCRAMRDVAVEIRQQPGQIGTPQQYRRFLAVDLAFHLAIVQCTGNHRVIKTLNEARAFIRIFCSRRHDALTLNTVAGAYAHHQRILHAIERREPEKAGRCMVNHICESSRGAAKYLQRADRINQMSEIDMSIHDDLTEEIADLI
jgi:DNA-binding GntR family transcriptional regulator